MKTQKDEIDPIYESIFWKWKVKYNIPIKVFKNVFLKRVERILKTNKYGMTEKEIEIWVLGSLAHDLWKLVS